jgi:hypothetical protein
MRELFIPNRLLRGFREFLSGELSRFQQILRPFPLSSQLALPVLSHLNIHRHIQEKVKKKGSTKKLSNEVQDLRLSQLWL